MQENINELYEKIYWKDLKEPESLFDDSEDYGDLRKYIMAQPELTYDKSSLPFEGLSVLPYDEYRLQQSIKTAKNNRNRLFYIKKENCYAVGYYKYSKGFFVILKGSCIAKENHFLSSEKELSRQRLIILKECSTLDGFKRFITEDIVGITPTDAAMYVLGRKACLGEWISEDGKKLSFYYPELERPVEAILAIINAVKAAKEKDLLLNDTIFMGPATISERNENHHLFYINKSGVCNASGYFDPVTNYFYIKQGSLISGNVDKAYASSALGVDRLLLLDKACVRYFTYYQVTKDAKCRDASIAACYVLGEKTTEIEWVDDAGNNLYKVYPSHFNNSNINHSVNKFDAYIANTKEAAIKLLRSIKVYSDIQPSEIKEKKKEPKIGTRKLYLKGNSTKNRMWDATGYYDNVTGQFLIEDCSSLSLDTTSAYRYTASDLQRRRFLKSNCKETSDGYKMQKDVFCNNPDDAATFVIGDKSDGWSMWVDRNGIPMKDIYERKN